MAYSPAHNGSPRPQPSEYIGNLRRLFGEFLHRNGEVWDMGQPTKEEGLGVAM